MAQPQKIPATVREIVDHVPGLRSLVFETVRRIPRFKPGQFLHLALEEYDPSQHWPESRCFSIVNPPEERRLVRITVSQVGRFTRRIMSLEVGDSVWLKLPYGDFVIQPRGDRPIVIVAGGTGIAPFVSLFSSDIVLNAPVRVFYGARRPELLIYRDVLERTRSRWPDFQWFAFAEEGGGPGLEEGRLNPERAYEVGGRQADYYLSGPPAMIEVFRSSLLAFGVPMDQVLIDAWG